MMHFNPCQIWVFFFVLSAGNGKKFPSILSLYGTSNDQSLGYLLSACYILELFDNFCSALKSAPQVASIGKYVGAKFLQSSGSFVSVFMRPQTALRSDPGATLPLGSSLKQFYAIGKQDHDYHSRSVVAIGPQACSLQHPKVGADYVPAQGLQCKENATRTHSMFVECPNR